MGDTEPEAPRPKEPPRWRRVALRVASRAAWLLAGMALGVALTLVVLPERRPEVFDTVVHGWRGAYHPDLLFLGKPMVRTDPELDFDWRRGSAWPGGGEDDFSVRWDTCLDMPQDATVELRAGSDDGVRAFVDGEKVVDDWSDHGFRRHRGAASLDKGPHHVLVEYYEKGGAARIEVDLVVPGDPEHDVPISWLRVPTRPFDDDEVCQRSSPASR